MTVYPFVCVFRKIIRKINLEIVKKTKGFILGLGEIEPEMPLEPNTDPEVSDIIAKRNENKYVGIKPIKFY